MRAVTNSIRCVFLFAALAVLGCGPTTIYHNNGHSVTLPRPKRVLNIALSWPSPADVDALKGATLLRDGARVSAELAIARAILRTNPRIDAANALLFAIETSHAAEVNGLPPEFLAATLLQESAYDPQAISAAGAIGLAQFMPETAADFGLDPYDPDASIAAAGSLIGGYVGGYRDRYDDPYAAALAAYNAGPLAVSRYHGVPPYPETREYVALIFDRWAQIVSYEPATGNRASAWKRDGDRR